MGDLMSDQATTLRHLRLLAKAKRENPTQLNRDRAPRVIAVTSGKGGVGKSNVVANVAVEFARKGQRVLILDADLGLANVDILLGLTPAGHLADVLSGTCEIDDIILMGPEGVHVLPAASGIAEVTELTDIQKGRLLVALERLKGRYDVLLVDTGAGISANVTYFAGNAHDVIVVLNPEPTALADAYCVIKVLNQQRCVNRFHLVVNSTHQAATARSVHERLTRVADRFLNVDIRLLGHIYADQKVSEAVMQQTPLVKLFPTSPAARCFTQLAQAIDRLPPAEDSEGRFWDMNLLAELS